MGPILASILFLAGSNAGILQGTLLLAVYSLGLELPFVLPGLFFSQFLRARERMKRQWSRPGRGRRRMRIRDPVSLRRA